MSGKYQAYPEYKDSAVAGISTLPAHWAEVPLKHVATCNDEVLPENTDPDFEFHYIDISSVSKTEGVTRTEKLKFSAAPSRARRVVKSGDVIVSTVRTYLEAIAPISHQHEGMVASTGFAVIRPTRLESTFAQYALRAQHFIDEVVARSTGVSYPAINASDLVCISTPVPPIQEQRTIAAFLDHETSRIDRLIEKQQRLIELLKEKRQAVISHAVTKGLDPNVPMKDSGVEWLGQVPEHWEVTKLKYRIRSMDQGWSPQCEARLTENGEFGVLKVGAVNGGVFRPQEHKALPAALAPRVEYRLKKGQLLISRANTRDLVGSAAVVPADFDHLLICDKLYRLSLSQDSVPEFIALVLGTPAYRQQIELQATGASDSMQNIGQAAIRELVIALPSSEEAQTILQQMKRQLSRLKALSDRLEGRSTLLKERRTALISAAVTGKIDVRNWQSSTSTQAAEPDLPIAAEQAGRYHV